MKNTAYMHGENAVEINIKENLTVSEKISFVDTVVHIMVRENYYPMLKKIAFDYAMISVFTDVNMEEFNTMDEIERFIEETNIVDLVETYTQSGLIAELDDAVCKSIEMKTGIRESRIENAIGGLIKALEEKVVGIKPDEIMDLANRLNGIKDDLTPEKLIDAYTKSERFQDLYNKITSEKEQKNSKSRRSKKNTSLKVVQ